ncbi:MAG: hypothetical protein K6G87_04340 [Butyrivibrio sp.]|uniref:hypothetical protein n=1 Tax=Butyrivibrio sp. TaxID=28121 RepID=UPI0025CFBC0C|nr:hypothetical protein [Butyrivibrio sp.]MCR5770447.1 hypothetical protein [Butyrivibrio sp.]
MKKKVVVALCSLMAVMSLAGCGKFQVKEWSGVYIGEEGSVLILCEDGEGYLNGGTKENTKIDWEIDDDEIVVECSTYNELTIDIDDKEPGDKITLEAGKKGENWNDEKFKRVEIYE